MHLQGSCSCKLVRFEVDSKTPYPYQCCYCSICRKSAGGNGGAVNQMAEAPTMRVEGAEHVQAWSALLDDPAAPGGKRVSTARRHFCKGCGSALWVSHPEYPQWVYPFASAVDTPLPLPPERFHIWIESKANWVDVPAGPGHAQFDRFSNEWMIKWHERHGLVEE